MASVAPKHCQCEMPVGEQLGQVKEAAKGRINEFVDQANLKFDQAKNDPSNKASNERLQQDVDATVKDAANSTNTAVEQVSNVVSAVKGAFVSTTNEGTATDSTPARRVESMSGSLGQTPAAVTDVVKNTFASRKTVTGTQPGLNNVTTNLPQDIPRRAAQ